MNIMAVVLGSVFGVTEDTSRCKNEVAENKASRHDGCFGGSCWNK